MPRTYDECLAKLTELAGEFGSGKHDSINEDTTRLRFVDALFFECLDWDRFTHVETEVNTDEGTIDYSFSAKERLLVVEAKKVGIAFDLPIDQSQKSRHLSRKLEAVISLGKTIEKAVSQVAGYALNEGIPFAAVCNGHQLIAFCTHIGPGKGWRKGNALVFDSLESIRAHFPDFWRALSVEGVKRFDLREMLSGSTMTSPHPRRSETILNFDKTKNRNDFQADLQILGDLVFGDRLFEDRQVFQEHCYCPGGAIPQFSRASRSYLEDRYPEFFASTAHAPALEPAQTKKGPAAALTNLTNIHKPILLLGDVGVGKTTFLEHLFLVDWADKKDQLIVLRVDLADKPSKPEDLPTVVASEIEYSLREHYSIDITEDRFLRAAYHSDLARFKKSPEGVVYGTDSRAYAEAELRHLRTLSGRFDDHMRTVLSHLSKGRQKMVVLVLDNVDQRPPKLQEASFVQAQIAASKWGVFVMIALRPETFVRARLDGSMSGYHPRAFTISPPRFDHLILKRIDTARAMLRGDLPITTIGTGATVQANNVAEYLAVLGNSFEHQPELVSFCEDLSGGNMRMALDYVIAFMSCGHVDARKILDRWSQFHSYTIPLHEFARGVMFAEREYYSEHAASLVINVFDCRSRDSRESFLICSVLSVLSNEPGDAGQDANGYLSIEAVRLKLMVAGYSYQQAAWAVERCLDHRLIETNVKAADLAKSSHIRLSPTGSYYLLKLVRTFVYMDAVCLDTPIADPETLQALSDSTLLDARTDRTSAFVTYLGGEFRKSPALKSICSWDSIAHEITQDVERARSSNARAQQRRESIPARTRPQVSSRGKAT